MTPATKKTTENPGQHGWLSSIAEAAENQGFTLPHFDGFGMGSARSEDAAKGRAVTFKRRLVRAEQAEIDGVEWTLWHETDGLPSPIAAFRDPQQPTQELIQETLMLLKGWLVDGWTQEDARLMVGGHPRVQPVEEMVSPGSQG